MVVVVELREPAIELGQDIGVAHPAHHYPRHYLAGVVPVFYSDPDRRRAAYPRAV